MIFETLKKSPLFAGIDEEEAGLLLNCLCAKTQMYRKDSYIFRAGERAALIGIVLSGGAKVLQEDFWGNRSILAHVGPGELFGEAFSCAEIEKLPVSVVSAGDSDIMLIDYRKIITSCPSGCAFHSRLISNMLRVLADKNILLTRKMEHISKRTTREKLLSFLSVQAVLAGKDEIAIPFNRQELADYLCVERSALSRELGEMKKDGLLSYDRNRFVLMHD